MQVPGPGFWRKGIDDSATLMVAIRQRLDLFTVGIPKTPAAHAAIVAGDIRLACEDGLDKPVHLREGDLFHRPVEGLQGRVGVGGLALGHRLYSSRAYVVRSPVRAQPARGIVSRLP